MRAKVKIETDERTDRERLIVTELPYQVNKAKLIEKIAELIQDERIEGHFRSARRIGSGRHPHRHRAQARGNPAHHLEQSV